MIVSELIIIILFASLICLCLIKHQSRRRKHERDAHLLEELQPWIDSLDALSKDELRVVYRAYRDVSSARDIKDVRKACEYLSKEEAAIVIKEYYLTEMMYNILYHKIQNTKDFSPKRGELSVFHPRFWFGSRSVFPDPDFE